MKINLGAYPAWFLFAVMPAIGAHTHMWKTGFSSRSFEFRPSLCDAKVQQPPQRVIAGNAEEAAHSVCGTDDMPLIVKVGRTPKTAEETA